MSDKIESKKICPHLGLTNDRGSRFSYPEAAHRCYATGQESPISLDHQSAVCLTNEHPTCSRFVSLADLSTSADLANKSKVEPQSQNGTSFRRTLFWIFTGFTIIVLTILGIVYYSNPTSQPNMVEISSTNLPASQQDNNPTITPTSGHDLVASTQLNTPKSDAFLATPTATATAPSDHDLISLAPTAGDIGWIASGEERGNHFSDSYLYAGVFEGQVYSGAFQFDLSSVPRGAPIYQASLELTGLREDRLSKNRDETGSGAWTLRLLTSDIDSNWRSHNFQTIFNAPVLQTLSPILSAQDLTMGETNKFVLTPNQIKELETRIIDDEKPKISFRMDGPLVGPDNLFAWDTGYGPQSDGKKVTLHLEVGPAPATPPSYKYVIVTSTPTPENIVTAAAIALQMTGEATRVGTATPIPPNLVTPTSIPDYLVIIPTEAAKNPATAQARSEVATAEAILYGTPTPISTNAVTATPSPSSTPTSTSMPDVPDDIDYVLITATPSPESVFAAATLSVNATTLAKKFGTPTPLPDNWVTPIVVTSTPTPINAQTAQAESALATVKAFTTGTPTSTPRNVVTATPTPVFVEIPLILPTAPVEEKLPPQEIPAALIGKILFKSNRSQIEFERQFVVVDPETGEQGKLVFTQEDQGQTLKEAIYVYDPETGVLGRLTDSWPYDLAIERDSWSADQRFRAFTKNMIRYKNIDQGKETVSVRNDAPAVYTYDYLYNEEQQLTNFGKGIAYNGVWSPTSDQIAFVSNDSSDDEIWVVNYDGSNLKQLTASNADYNAHEIGKDSFIPEINKYPSWSPDGSQIIFTSNRTGNDQLWIMNADGTDQHLLMGWDNWTPYNDSAPVWVKYSDPASIE